MTNDTIDIIERRASADRFDPSHALTTAEIEHLIHLATRAPTAYNLQNWRFVAVRSAKAKARLRELAHDQPKVSEAAVTFLVCGVLPDPTTVVSRLRAFVEAGFGSEQVATAWQEDAQRRYADPIAARDEAVRSATFGAATLIQAATASGLASCPMVGFDAAEVARAHHLGPDELPVMLVAIGRAAPGNWPQKPRRPVADVLVLS